MNLQNIALRHGAEERRACFASVAEDELLTPQLQPETFLSDPELARMSTLKMPLKRQGFLLGRLAAKKVLGTLLAEPDLRRIEISSGVFGQPLVQHPRAGRIEVTMSHSHGLAVALAYPGELPMGVDLETVSAAAAGTILGELQLSAEEKTWLAKAAIGEEGACGVFWTAREALGKSMKSGLNCPLGILALEHIEAAGAAGAAAWQAHYKNFPQSQCLSQAIKGRILSLAMPIGTRLSAWPRL